MNENNVPNNENNVFNNGGFSQFEAADGPLSVSDKADMQKIDTDVEESSVSTPSEPPIVADDEPKETSEDIAENAAGASSFGAETFKTYSVSDREDTPSSSGGYVYTPGAVSSTYKAKEKNALNTASNILFGLSFPALLASFIAMFVHLFTGSGNIVIIFSLALAIANVVVGSLLRKSKNGGTKNLVLGIIATAFSFMMLIISNMDTDIFDFVTDFENEYDSVANEYIETAESFLGVDLPEYDDFYETNNGFSYVYYYDLQDVVAMAEKNSNFLTSVPTTFVGMLPVEERSEYFDYCLIYNLDTREYNKLPRFPCECRMICITVTKYYNDDDEGGEIGIYVYDLNYTNYVKSDT